MNFMKAFDKFYKEKQQKKLNKYHDLLNLCFINLITSIIIIIIIIILLVVIFFNENSSNKKSDL